MSGWTMSPASYGRRQFQLGSRDHQRVMCPSVIHGVLKCLRVARTTQTERDHLRTGVRSGHDRIGDGCVGSRAGGIEDFEDDYLYGESDSRHPGRIICRRGYGAGDVRTVAVIVLPGAGRGGDCSGRERLTGTEQDLAAVRGVERRAAGIDEVRMRAVETSIENRDLDPLRSVAGLRGGKVPARKQIPGL